jgi:hypothetical protein
MTIVPRFVPLTEDAPHPGDMTIIAVNANDTAAIEGDWFDLKVLRDGGVDLRGWRITDNDSIQATDEGSLIFMDDPLLANLSPGTIVRVVASESVRNSKQFPADGRQDGVLLIYVGNGRIDTASDPWFNLGRRDNLVLLAPGQSADLADDIPIDFWGGNPAVTPASFGLPPK